MGGLNSFFRASLGLIFLGLVFAIPSGLPAWFDGLPWVGELETIVLAVITPLLLILGWKFLALRFSIIFLGILLLFKVVLFFGSPQGGWVIKVYPNITQEQTERFFPFKWVESNTWVKTYATLWNKKASGILNKPWSHKLDFPLDWALFRMRHCRVSTKLCFDELNPIVEIDGFLLLPRGKKFAVIANGLQEGTLLATNEHGEEALLTPAKNFNEATEQAHQLSEGGKWRISGKFNYYGEDWSLIPVLVEADGKLTSDLGRMVLWQNEEELSSKLGQTGFYKIVSYIFDGGIIFFLLAWVVWITQSLSRMQVLNLPLLFFSALAVISPIIFAPVFSNLLSLLHSPDPTTNSYLGFSITAVGICYLVWTQWRKDFRNYQIYRTTSSIVLLFGPAVLIFFSMKWRSIIGRWEVWGAGNDWTSYQAFARNIVVEGDWLIAGTNMFRFETNIFIMQPLYRYFVGVYHWLFGQSAFVQHIADVWCVLGAMILIISFAIKLRLSSLIIYSLSIVFLAINLISALRYHIGRGLVENHAMIFMMLAAWFLFRAREGGASRIFLATLFGVFGYWIRQDHLGAIAGLVFLVLEPIEGPTGGWRGYWERFKIHWKLFACYWGGGVFSILLICFRHWWLEGVFYPTIRAHPNFVLEKYSPFPESFYIILAGKNWPGFPGVLGLILTSGVLIALLASVWPAKILKNFPLSLSIIIVGLLAPYVFFMNWGYAPRYSIHLFPIALLSAAIILDKLYLGVADRFNLN